MPFLELEGSPDLENNPRELNGVELIVGSGSQATWRIPGRDLAARHFRLQVIGGDARLIPASAQNVVVLNGKQAPTEGVTLRSGDVIAAGSARFVFLNTLDDPRPEPPGEAAPALLIDHAAKKGYTLRKRVVQIGREIGCSIVLKDPTVSRFHADVRSEGGEYVLYSMGSSGTKINGQSVTVPRMLEEGDQIAIGDTVFTFSRRPLPPGIRSVQFEDHADDSFSRRNTQLATRAVTAELGKYPGKRGRKRSAMLPWILGGAVVVVAIIAFLVLRG
ncbi:MAG: FHA domain-containing protein [Gemmatimonadaceae bacterium]|nr:FHA domain-containing protein [Gemmatimonadaceae bacterium]